jgi:uncharacterized protein (UPF0262 family)
MPFRFASALHRAVEEMGDLSSRIVDLIIDDASLAASSADAEHERRVAIFDLLAENHFGLVEAIGPYHLHLSRQDNRLVFDVRDTAGQSLRIIALSVTPLRRHIRDYFLICESYYTAIREAGPQQIEAIDMGRRGLHNEGAEALRERLAGKADVDLDTARRLFTLLCSLHRQR